MDFAGFFLTSFLASLDFAITIPWLNAYDKGTIPFSLGMKTQPHQIC
jgi:hypothetical protein